MSAHTPEMCCHKVRVGGSFMPRYLPCKNKAIVEVDGKHYCGVHNPVARKERQDARSRASEAAHQERMRVYRLQAAAPQMLETLQWLDSIGGLGLTAHERIRAAIAKATGATP